MISRRGSDRTPHEADNTFRLIFENNPIPMWVHDTETLAFREVNDAAVRTYGYSRDEFLAMKVDDLLSPEDSRHRSHDAPTVSATGEKIALSRHRTKGGRFIEVESTAHAMQFGGRYAELVLAQDVTERKRAEEAVRESSELQQLLMRMATNFVNVPIERIDDTIHDALETIGAFVRADRAYLFKYDFAAGTMSNTHEWCAAGISEEIKNSQNIPNGFLPDVVHAHKRGDVFVVPRVTSLPKGDKFREILDAQKIQSLILFPMIYGRELLGFVGFDAVREERVFTETETVLLKVLAEILANTEMHRRNDDSLRESEEKFRALVENTTDLIWEIDADGKYTYVSPQIHTLLGYTPGETIGMTPFDLMPPEEAERVKRAFEEFSRDKRSINGLENINRHKDGHLVVMETSGIPILDKAGCLRGYRGIDRDVSERKHAEESLRLRSAALETAANAIAITRRDGIIQWINPAFTHLTGYDAPEAIGQNPRILNSGMNDRGVFEELWKTILAGQSWQGEITNRKKDGTLYIIEQTVTPVRDPDGNVSHFVSVNQDITERKKVEKAVRESEARLRAIIDAEPECVKVIGLDGRLLEMNPSGLAMLEAESIDEVQTKSLLEFVVPEHRVGFTEYSRRTIEGIQDPPFQFEVIGQKGTRRWLETNAVLLRDAESKPTALLAITRDITERKQAIEELAAKEQRYRTLFNLSPAGIVLIDSSGVIIETNDAYCRSHQYMKDELVGKDIRLLVPAEGHNKVGDHLLRILSGETLEHEVVNLRKDGSRGTIELRETPVSLPNGRRGILSVANDVTERKRAEEALRISEEQYRTFFVFAPIGIGVTDYMGNLLAFNEAILVPGGYSREDIQKIGNIAGLYYDPDARVEVLSLFTRQGVLNQHPVKFKRKDGTPYDTLLTLVSIQFNGERCVQALVEDVSYRKHAEEALRSSEERYRRFFEKDLTGIFISTPEGRILDCNPAYARIFGFASREEVLNTNAIRLYEGSEQRNAMLDMLRERKELQNIEMTLRRIDGTKVHVFETIIGTFDDNGNLVQLMGYISDKTRQKQLEQQLMQSQKMESLGTLASGIAHDFNNILGIILGHASLLTDSRLRPEKSPHHAASILKATERGVGVVKQLLTFARKTDVMLEPVQLNEIVLELMKLLRGTFPKTIAIATDLAERLPFVVADANQMHQVMLNLCVNARDAMPGGGKLTITTRAVSVDEARQRWHEASAPAHVILSVSDTGMGMDEATRARIFEPFFTTKERGKGTGLGLATVYGIVQTHKGWIDVQSRLGQGSMFSLYFPVQTRITEQRNEPVPSLSDLREGSERILVVEDEQMLREMLTDLLTSKGYKVIAAADGIQGVELYKQHSPEIGLVFSDLGLPRLGGDKFFLMAKSVNPAVKFILATGFIEPSTKADLINQGLQHIINKPYYPAHLLKKIREVLDAQLP